MDKVDKVFKRNLSQKQIPRQQRRQQTRDRWIEKRFDIFQTLVTRVYGEELFAGCVWVTDKRRILDIFVPPAEAGRFVLVSQPYLWHLALKAGFVSLRLSFVTPEVVNGLFQMIEERNA